MRLFLAGKDDQVLTQLIARMEKASQALAFEEAARIRDQIQAVRRVTEKQFVSNNGDDLDVIGVAFEAGMACVHVLFIRQGKCWAAAVISRKFQAIPNWAKWWKPSSASSISQAARCERCRADPARLYAERQNAAGRFVIRAGGASHSGANQAAR